MLPRVPFHMSHMIHRRTVLKTLALAPALTSQVLSAASPPADAAPATVPTPYRMEPLGYAFGALEPFIDAQTMEIHYSRHHASYVTSLNKAVAGHPELAKKTPIELISKLAEVPEDIRATVRNHGGGHVNHTLFWQILKRNGGLPPSGPLMEVLVKTFGTFETFQSEFTKAAMSVFGSGWVWLSKDPGGQIGFDITPNQDSPYMAGRTPLLGIDVWEHAYYLKYQNKRADYVAAFFNVINWDVVARRLTQGA